MIFRISRVLTPRLCIWGAMALAGMGCDSSPRARDAAAAPLEQHISEIAVRIDAPAGGAPSLSALAFRATAVGLPVDQVLAVVDPLATPMPEARCELRDAAFGPRALRAAGGTVELEDFGNLALSLTDGGAALHLAPRIYPDYASVVAGVVGEMGPVDLLAVPGIVTVAAVSAQGLGQAQGQGLGQGLVSRIPLTIRDTPRFLTGAGEPLGPAAAFDANGDLSLQVTGPAGRTFVELRPFGATLAIACPVGPAGRVTISAEMVDRLGPVGRTVPASLDAISRESQIVTLAGQATHLSVEVRTSTVLELRP